MSQSQSLTDSRQRQRRSPEQHRPDAAAVQQQLSADGDSDARGRSRRERRRPHERRPRRHQLHDRRRRAAAGAQPGYRQRDQPQRSLLRRPHRGRVSGAIRAALRLGLQHVDAGRDGPARLRRVLRRSARTPTLQSTLGYHAPLAGGGGYDIALSGEQTTRGLDPPDFNSPHNDASSVESVRALHAARRRQQLHEHHVHQQPRARIRFPTTSTTANRPTPTTTKRKPTRSWRCSSTTRSAIPARSRSARRTRSRGSRTSAIRRTTWLYGEALNVDAAAVRKRRHVDGLRQRVRRRPDESDGLPDDVRLFARRPADGARLHHAGRLHAKFRQPHDRAPASPTISSRVLKYYAVTLQPNNFLAPILTPSTPDAPTTVIDDAPNLGNTYQSYIQDSWRMSNLWEADYGIRYDFFTIKSTGFAQGLRRIQPAAQDHAILRKTRERLRVHRAILRAVLVRKREPGSGASCSISRCSRPIAQFDLKPERDTQLEFGGHIPRRRRRPGLSRVAEERQRPHRRHAGRRYAAPSGHQLRARAGCRRRRSTTSSRCRATAARTSRSLTSSRSTAVAKRNCSRHASGSRPASRPPTTSSATVSPAACLLNDRRGGWFSADGEYGSGLSSAFCPAERRDTAKRRRTRRSTWKKGSR